MAGSRPSLLPDWCARRRIGAQISHELTHRQGMKADLFDMRLTAGFELLLRPDGARFCFEILERVADDALAACNGNITAR